MSHRVAWRIALPMIGLGVVLLGLGVAAAWNVHHQQQVSSDLIAGEVSGVIAIEDLHLEMREIRYQLNLFLRTKQVSHLSEVAKAHERADDALLRAKTLVRHADEAQLIHQVEDGYRVFFDRFQSLVQLLSIHPDEESIASNLQFPEGFERQMEFLSDETLTHDVIDPLRECISVNQQVVARANEASHATAQHLRIGFLLLGVCGGVAGLLMGIGIARAVRQSIVQLDVSVRSVAGRLTELTGPVQFSHIGDLAGLGAGLRKLEDEIVEMVERFQQQEIELLRSEQLAQVGQLAAGLAHELRNPLMPMKMLVQAALERHDEAGLKGRSLQVINDEIARLEQSIQSFLDFARPPAIVKTDVPFQDIVRQTVDLVAVRVRAQSVELHVSMPDEPIVMRVDRGQIRQLLLNLILNALDAMKEVGAIHISAAAVVRDVEPTPTESTPEVNHEFSEHDALRMRSRSHAPRRPEQTTWLQLHVIDSGPGIPTDKLGSIFDPFVTTKETGTGLGLTICRRIVTAHQGLITVANRSTGGAEFTVLLPCSVN